MKKSLLYFFLLLFVGLGIYYFIFRNQDTSFNKDETNFTIKDTANIGRIYFVRNNGEHIDLKRTDQGWITNNTYPSRISTVNYLLQTLFRQIAKYPAPAILKDGIIKTMAGISVKVEVYDLKGQLMTSYYVGPDEENEHGTYMLNTGAKTIYFVQIPNYDGCLSAIYGTSVQDWRSRNVFSIPATEIVDVSVQYIKQTKKSFIIHQTSNVSIEADASVSKNKSMNEERVKSFLKFFQDVNCEGYLMNIPGMDTVIAMMPHVCNIAVVDKKGKKSEVDIYLKPINKRSKNIGTEDTSTFDVDRMYAVFNSHKDTAVIQYLSFEKLLRSAEEFFESNSTVVKPRK